MSRNYLGVRFAVGALGQVRTFGTGLGVASVFPVTFPICRVVRKDLIVWADIAVIVYNTHFL